MAFVMGVIRRIVAAIFRSSKPVNQESCQLSPEEVEQFRRQMREHGVVDMEETPNPDATRRS